MNRDHDDTRRFDTHAEWCAHLARNGSLDAAHRLCTNSDKCVSTRLKAAS